LSESLATLASALPFFQFNDGEPYQLGPLPLQPFGILVATGVLIGAWLARKHAAKLGLDDDELRGLSAWVLVGGFAGAHIFDVLAYQWDKLMEDPLLLIKVWAGISSYGGLLGGAIGGVLYCRRKKLDLNAYGDAIVYGFLPAFTIGRIGCATVHDHVGRATDFPLGVDYPVAFAAQHGYKEATRMHNLGLYELMYLIPVCLILAWVARKPRPYGLIAVLAGTLYAPVRFFLDFLRFNESDPRYLYLTFAQWMSVIVTVAGVYGLIKLWNRPAVPFPTAEKKLEKAETVVDSKPKAKPAAKAKAKR
jgi:phosphatidylglycerol:prolipoprotein diacylglycerol transferase